MNLIVPAACAEPAGNGETLAGQITGYTAPGMLVLMRRRYERIFIGDDVTIEVIAITSYGDEESSHFGRLVIGFPLDEGGEFTLEGMHQDVAGATAQHRLTVGLKRARAKANDVRLEFVGSDVLWRAELPVGASDPSFRDSKGGGVSLARSRFGRVAVGESFSVTVSDIRSRRARLEVSASLYAGETFTCGETSVTMVSIERGRVRIGIICPRHLPVDREEIFLRKKFLNVLQT